MSHVHYPISDEMIAYVLDYLSNPLVKQYFKLNIKNPIQSNHVYLIEFFEYCYEIVKNNKSLLFIEKNYSYKQIYYYYIELFKNKTVKL